MTDTAAIRALANRFGTSGPESIITPIDIVRELKLSYKQAERVLALRAPLLPGMDAVLPLPAVPVLTWTGCYGKSWKGFVHEDSFKHPAKYSRNLIEKILRHGIEQNYWQPGDLIGDPFGGVGLGGVVATYLGLRWVGNELEPAFHSTAKKNFEMHKAGWTRLGREMPVITLGDSRHFDTIISGAVTSPPFSTDQPCASQTRALKDYEGMKAGGKREQGMATVGNIQTLKHSELSAAITSPPYADTMSTAAGGADTAHPDGFKRAMHGRKDRYGVSDGQIGAMPAEALDGTVTSPPWEKDATGHIGADKFADPKAMAATMAASGKGHPATMEARQAQFERDKKKSYGDTPGQIGQAKKETYWQAMRQVYEAMYRCLKPGGYAAVVVKDYVRNKKRVHLCDDTLRLLVFVGFEGVERIHALLVEPIDNHGPTDMLGDPTKESAVVTRKSFFKRVHESKPGAVTIDWEEVIIVRKPHE